MEIKDYNINDIADYVILKAYQDGDRNLLINLKLQKLLYYIQAWSLAIRGKIFFNGKFQAWVHGPVSPELYNRFKETKSLYSQITVDDVLNKNIFTEIDKNDKDFIDYILENYMGFTGVELENMTHSELPWQEARNGISPMGKCVNYISEKTMEHYYGERWEKINK